MKNLFNSLHPSIKVCIFSILFRMYILPKVLAMIICLTVKSFFSWLSVSLFSCSHDLNVGFRGDIAREIRC